jgi:GGDEF domain-containing protein
MQDPGGEVVGVLQLINALDDAGEIVAFHRGWEPLVRSLASQAAVAIQNVRLQELSFKDPLTGIYNRRYFSLRLDEELRRQMRSGRGLSLILVDVDDFKTLNDTKGHRAGDEALLELATMLSAQPARSLSITSRYGGDEFAVLIRTRARPPPCSAPAACVMPSAATTLRKAASRSAPGSPACPRTRPVARSSSSPLTRPC